MAKAIDHVVLGQAASPEPTRAAGTREPRSNLDLTSSLFGKLALLASQRDIISGRYCAAPGGASEFADPDQYLRTLHKETFLSWLQMSLSDQFSDIIMFLASLDEPQSALLARWNVMEPYRGFTPTDIDPVEREYFVRTVSILLALLRSSGQEGSLSIKFTPREQEVMCLVMEGRADKEIAEALKVSFPTVRHHLSNLFRKCSVSSRTALVKFLLLPRDHNKSLVR